MKRLYVDIGSTNIKSAVSADGEFEGVERVAFPAPAVDGNFRFEVDVDKILERVHEIVDRAACEEVYISTQMHGYLLADAQRRPVTRYISWQDRRAQACGIQLKIAAPSGTAMKGNLPRAGVEAIRRTQPEVYGRAAEFFTLGSYVAYALTGNNATHITDAAASGYYNVRERTVYPCALRLPQAEYEVRSVGRYRGVYVYAPMGDQQCSVLGAGADERTYVLNLGTAGQLCTVAKGYVSGDYESRPYFGGDTLCTVTGLSGGKRLKECGKEDVPSLAAEYAQAMARLPKREKLLVTGGAYAWHRDLLEGVLERLEIAYTVNEGADALAGLKEIAEEKNG